MVYHSVVQPVAQKGVLLFSHYRNRIRNAIINASSPTASVRANPKMANRNNSFRRDGFRAVPKISDPNTTPTPTPAPTNPIVANPAPTSFPSSNTCAFCMCVCFCVAPPLVTAPAVIHRRSRTDTGLPQTDFKSVASTGSARWLLVVVETRLTQAGPHGVKETGRPHPGVDGPQQGGHPFGVVVGGPPQHPQRG